MTNARLNAQQARDSAWLEHSVRVGLVAYGLVHLLICWLALQLALGDRSGAPDQQGALRTLAQQPYGEVLLWVVALGLVALAIWQVTEALWGHTREDGAKRAAKRLGSVGRVAIYALLAFSALETALGQGSSGSSDSMTARLMDLPFGRLLVGLVGVVVWVVAIVHVYRALTTSFDEDLEPGARTGASGTATVRLGQAGYLAKGAALAIVGSLFLWAAWTYDAKKSGGLDVALRTLLDAPVGPWLLGAVAVGLGCFGLYCFAWARYADTGS